MLLLLLLLLIGLSECSRSLCDMQNTDLIAVGSCSDESGWGGGVARARERRGTCRRGFGSMTLEVPAVNAVKRGLTEKKRLSSGPRKQRGTCVEEWRK